MSTQWCRVFCSLKLGNTRACDNKQDIYKYYRLRVQRVLMLPKVNHIQTYIYIYLVAIYLMNIGNPQQNLLKVK